MTTHDVGSRATAAGWKRPSVVGGNGAKRIASPEDLEDQVLPGREHLENLHAAGGNRVERIRRRVLLEDHLPLVVRPDRRRLRNRPQILWPQLAEHRCHAQDRLDFS